MKPIRRITKSAAHRRGQRRRYRFESLERRQLLAAGFLPLDLTVPINRTVEGFTVVGTAQVGADVVILDPADPSQLSITNPVATGSGTLSGSFLGAQITGNFAVDDTPPMYEFDFQPPNRLLVEVRTTGTLDLLVDGAQRVPGTFTSTVEGEFDAQTLDFEGFLRLVASADGFQETIDVPVVVDQAIESLVVPDASLASIADQIFADANDNGVMDAGETGVGGVKVELLDGQTDAIIESTTSDGDGFYSFYNLASGSYAVRVDQLPDGFDLGKQDVGDNDTIDSDVNSRTGRSGTVVVDGGDRLRDLDVALRQVAFEWQNPNLVEDVTGEGEITALDALRIINLLGRNGGPVALADDRPIGSEFFDVTGDGSATALDALRVINAIARARVSALDSEETASEQGLRTDLEAGVQPQLF